MKATIIILILFFSSCADREKSEKDTTLESKDVTVQAAPNWPNVLTDIVITATPDIVMTTSRFEGVKKYHFDVSSTYLGIPAMQAELKRKTDSIKNLYTEITALRIAMSKIVSGPAGPAGPQGIQGLKGATGPAGPAGANANVDLTGILNDIKLLKIAVAKRDTVYYKGYKGTGTKLNPYEDIEP